MSIDTKAYFNLLSPKYIDWSFYEQYTTKEPPFGELGVIVYLRTYSRFIEELGRREKWCETVLRNIEYSLSLDTTSTTVTKRFEARALFDMMFNMRGFPSGRSLWTAGTPQTRRDPSSSWNCFSGDTKFLTRNGYLSFNQFNDGDTVEVLSLNRCATSWKTATVKKFGKAKLYKLTLARGRSTKEIYTTGNHRWLVRTPSTKYKSFVEKTTLELSLKDRFPIVVPRVMMEPCSIGTQHGIVYGDGHYETKDMGCRIDLQSDKQELVKFFDSEKVGKSHDVNETLIYNLPYYFKSLPDLTKVNKSYLLGFLSGWFAADGTVTDSGFELSNSSYEVLDWARNAFSTVGFVVGDIRTIREQSPYDGSDKPLYGLRLFKNYIPENFLIRGKHIENHTPTNDLDNNVNYWSFKSLEETDIFDDVWCVSEPETETFTLDGNILTRNCTFRAIDSISSFSEIFYWLLIGAGTGFSVEQKYISQLPTFNPYIGIKQEEYTELPASMREEDTEVTWDYGYVYLNKNDLISDDVNFSSKLEKVVGDIFINIGDSKEAWCNGLRAFLVLSTRTDIKTITFNYDNIRPEGSRIKVFGGRSSGHKAVQQLFSNIYSIIQRCNGQLDSVGVLDIVNCIGLNVVSGGVRRTAEIGLGDVNDDAFVTAKKDLWTDPAKVEYRSIRSMSNNSVLLYENPGLQRIEEIMDSIRSNGEPGFWIIGNSQKLAESPIAGTNPCAEAALDNRSSCNLTTKNVAAHIYWSESTQTWEYDYEQAEETIRLITRIGCRQTLATQWHPDWDETQKRDRLLGVSMTGFCDAMDLLGWDNEEIACFFKWVKTIAIEEANKYHDSMGINRSTRVTLMKPEGCRPWDALTTTNQGIFTLEELFINHPIDSTWANIEGYDAINNGENNKITKTYVNGKAPVHRITLWFGHELESTPNHQWFVTKRRVLTSSKSRTLKFETVNQWVRTDELQAGDVIEVFPNSYNKTTDSEFLTVDSISFQMREDATVMKQPTTMCADIAWLLGYLWGDGYMCTQGYRLRFIDQHEYNLLKVQKILLEYFGLNVNIHKCKDRDAFTLEVGSKMLWHWLIKNNVWKYYNDELDLIPQIVRTSSKESIIAFVAGLVDSDGCVSGRNFKSKHCVYLSTTYDLFAKHLQEVCLTVGLSFGRSLNTKGGNKQKVKHIWSMALTQYTDIESFNTLAKHSNKIMRACLNDNPVWVFQTTNRTVKQLGEVKDVEFIGEKATYDIEVENTHYYYAGAFKSHNTISQLPTVSSGIHRAYAPFFYRRVRFSKTDPLATVLLEAGMTPVPENGQGDDLFAESCSTWVFTFAVKSDAKIRAIDEPALDQLERYRIAQVNYADRGHNVSATITLAPDEYDVAAKWINDNWNDIIGVSFLPRFDPVEGGSAAYPNMPYEPCTEEQYKQLKSTIPVLSEEQLIDVLTKYESRYEDEDLGSDCQGVCPVR